MTFKPYHYADWVEVEPGVHEIQRHDKPNQKGVVRKLGTDKFLAEKQFGNREKKIFQGDPNLYIDEVTTLHAAMRFACGGYHGIGKAKVLTYANKRETIVITPA